MPKKLNVKNPDPEEPKEPKYECGNCGFKTDIRSKFCPQCGTNWG